MIKKPHLLNLPDWTDSPVDYSFPFRLPSQINHPIKKILVTGVTGKIGGYLLKTLYEDTDAEIICLVRGKHHEVDQKVLDNLLFYNDEKCCEKILNSGRVKILNSDLLKPCFGLQLEVYTQLLNEVDCVLHAAATTSLLESYEKLYPENVATTQEIINFTLQTKTKYLIYLSSYTIFAEKIYSDRPPLTEIDFDLGQSFIHMGYQKTKYEAEKIIRDAQKNKDLKAIILRLGNISGDSVKGRFKYEGNIIADFFSNFFVILLKENICPMFMYYLDLTPVDYCCKAIVHLGVNKQYFDACFHIVNPIQRRAFEYGYFAQKLGITIKFLSPGDYFKKLVELVEDEHNTVEKIFLNQIKFYQNYFFARGGCRIESAYTQFVLSESKIICPPIDKKYMQMFFDQLEKTFKL